MSAHQVNWSTLTLLLGFLAIGCPSEPCEVLETPSVSGLAAPAAGDGLVALDSLVWLRVSGPFEDGRCLEGEGSLTDSDGTPIELEDAMKIGSPARALIGWRPVDGLQSDTDYEFRWEVQDGEDAGVVSFRTGDEPVSTAPIAPTPLNWETQVGPARLGQNKNEAIDYDDYVEFLVRGGRFVLVHDDADAPPAGTVPEDVFRIGAFGFVWSQEPVTPSRTVDLRFAAMDLAGNISPWSAPVAWPIPATGRTEEGSFE